MASAPVTGELLEDEIDLRQYLRVLWKRRWLIAGVVLAACFTAYTLTRFSQPIYEATTTVLIRRGVSGLPLAGGASELLGMSRPNVQNVVEILKSRSVMVRTLRRLQWPDVDLEKDLATIQSAVTVQPVQNTDHVRVRVRLPDPDRVLRAYPFQLSGGMRQRVLIAMALVNEPDLVIADEPGTALDVTIQAQILLLLRDLVERQGISVLLISHNLGVVRQVTRRVCVMYAGTIVEVAPTAALFRTPRHPYTQGLLAAVPKLTGEGVPAGIEGMIPDYVAPPPGCRFAPRCPYAMAVCDTPPPAIPVGPTHQAACWLYSSEAVLASGQAHGHGR